MKKVIEHTIEEGSDDKTENCSTDDKSGDDQSTKSEDDMDSGVTFDEDSEKDIDTAGMIGRPRKRWEDDINDFLKQILEKKENEEPIERRIQNNNMWINIAIDRKEWTRLEEKYTLQNAKLQKD